MTKRDRRKKTAFGRLRVLVHQVQEKWKRVFVRSGFKIRLAFQFYSCTNIVMQMKTRNLDYNKYINNIILYYIKNYIIIEYFQSC